MKKFAEVDTWVFDLDNTLYPPSCKLFDQIAVRMTDYMMTALGLSKPKAQELRHSYYKKYGTTLRGLMIEHNMPPHGFLDYVHDIDYTAVPADTALIDTITALPGRKLVFTAGTRKHANAVLNRLGSEVFEAVYDIADADFIPKPAAQPYDVFLKAHGVEPSRAAFFEDISENLLVPRAMGMVTVLVGHHDEALLPAHVDYVTGNLSSFLESIFHEKRTKHH